MNRFLPADRLNRWMLLLLLAVWTVSCIRVPYPEYFWLQHLPTCLAVVALVIWQNRLEISRLSYACLIVFLLLHVLGARYLYSNVPYDQWSEWLVGFSITKKFDFQRNHYDRLVYFAYGLLITVPAFRFSRRVVGLAGRWCGVAALGFILATGAAYEILEWLLAMWLAPDWAESYNGQQGDVWDAQRDLAMAAMGSLTCLVPLACASLHPGARGPSGPR